MASPILEYWIIFVQEKILLGSVSRFGEGVKLFNFVEYLIVVLIIFQAIKE